MLLAQSRGRAGASRPRSPVRFVHSSAAPTAPPQGSSKAASQMGSHSTSGRTEGTESASLSPAPRRSPHRSARSSRAGATDTFPRTVSTPKAPQVDPSPPIHIGKFAPLPLPKIPTKSETFAPPHFRPADGRPTPLQPFRLRLQGFRSVGLPSAPPTLRAGPDHTPPQIISNQTIPDPPRLSRRVTPIVAVGARVCHRRSFSASRAHANSCSTTQEPPGMLPTECRNLLPLT